MLVSGLIGTIQLTVSECNAPVVMGSSVSDIGRWFVSGGLGLGVAVALLLRFTRKSD